MNDQDIIMDDDFSIQRVITPPLVDPLTEAANAHLAALAQAEAAEMIINPEDQKNMKKQQPPSLERSDSSSSCSLSEQHLLKTEDEDGPCKDDDRLDLEDKQAIKLKVPIPLVEENKEPGVIFRY